MAVLSQELLSAGYDGARMVSNGMLPDGTVEIELGGKTEEVKDEPKKNSK